MAISVIKTGGKQYVVKPGDKIKIEKLSAAEGSGITFDTLLTADENGQNLAVGKPILNTKTKATIVAQGRHKKITVIKYKAKVRYRKQHGHRQHYTQVSIA